MSENLQPGTMNRPNNGHARRTGAKTKVKAKAKTRAAIPAAMPLTGPTAQTAPIVGRIGTVPVTIPAVTATTGTLAWLFQRQQEIEIEGRVIRGMIASFGPRRMTATGTTGTRTRKRRKARRAAPARQTAA